MYKPQTIDGVQLTSEMVEQIVKNATEKKEFIKIGQIYWFLDDIRFDCKKWENNEFDNYRLARGNVFLTEEAAKKAENKRLALGTIQQYIRDNDLEFEPNWYYREQMKWQICGWDYTRNNCLYDWPYSYNTSKHNLIFKTAEDRLKVIDNCAKELEVLLK
jgi:hypothetical protein